MKNILLNDLWMCFRVIALQSEKFSNVHVDFVPSAILCHRIKLFQKYRYQNYLRSDYHQKPHLLRYFTRKTQMGAPS